MKYPTYFATFLAYTTVHMMRMSLTFAQLKLMQFFGINNFEIGIANACLYIVLGISYFWRALYPIKQNKQFEYFWSMNLCNLIYLIIPLLITIKSPITPLFYLCYAGFGFFQTAAWPVMLSLVHNYFLPKRDGCMLGFWSASGDIGNILGFALGTFLTYNLKLPFQYSFVSSAVCSIIMTIVIYKLHIEPSQISKEELVQEQLSKQSICIQYKKALKQPQVGFMLIMICMFKGLLYGILLWLPMYFDKAGFKQYQGYIPIMMNTMGVLGSIILGFIYQKISNKALRAVVFMSSLLITCACFFIVQKVQFTIENRVILQILISIIGFCIMGNFNILSTHEVTVVCDRLGIQITAFSSLIMCIANIFVGIIELIIGKFATDDSNSVFLIFFIMTVVLIVIEITRIIVLYILNKQKDQEEQIYAALENNLNKEG